MAARLPGAADVDSFWTLLLEGHDAIREVPPDRWDWRAQILAAPRDGETLAPRWGGFIDGVDRFDPTFFGLSPREAAFLDPQARLLLEAVQFQSPQRGGMFRPKLRYAHQGGMNPPIVVIHGTSLSGVTDSYKRYLEGRFREVFKLTGTPLRIQMNTAKNPYVDTDKGKKGKKR